MSISENYADQMIAARGQSAPIEDDGFAPGRALATLSGGPMIAAQGAVHVAVHRDEARILAKLKVMANAAGQRWYYRWTTNNKDGTKGVVEGPSIDCAMAVARLYGNCDINLRVEENLTHWTFYAGFRDFESGFTVVRAFQQRKSQKTGMKDADRQADIVFQIGQSKAIRNVIVNALADFADFAFEAAKGSFVERIGSKLEDYRKKAVARFGELGIDIRRVENVIGKAAKDWLAPDVARIIAELQAIGDGMASADETYPVLVQQQDDGTEPVREAAPKAQRQPRKAREPEKPADETVADGGGDIETFIEKSEAEAKAAATLTELAELDEAVTKTLIANGVDNDVQKYWRSVVAGANRALSNA
jgi:hypothetical protein